MVRRMAGIAQEAGLPFSLVLNKTTPEILPDLQQAMDGLDVLAALPMTPRIFMATLKGKALENDLPEMGTLVGALNG